jgi:hypothetical protein
MATPERNTPAIPFQRKPVVSATQWSQQKKNPPAVMAIWGALALALMGNIAQYTSLRSAEGRAANTMNLARAKWDNERTAMETELDQLRRQTKLTAQDRTLIVIELDKLRFDLVSFEQQIYKAEVERANATRLLKDAEDLQKPRLAEAQQKIIAAIDKKTTFLRSEQESLLTRRSELQAQLN